MVQLTDEQIELYRTDEEGRAYLEYDEIIGGEPIGLTVPFGYPDGVEEMGGVISVYQTCIEQGKTWEELLDYEQPNDADI
ncbi:hypothetical protein [Tepidibacillus decaturensis]|uniref:Uncharacterized protein n=1 Tax=Tepidibacillus decaturensis TaxID=1413211 RepID=A0A135L144_9BACI|nr:hypothetical protein [Tepidibacillus decaturensis]KXG42665.1 hypothetical protein U473_00335 [Tepidibacillus decaturensis]